MNDVDRIHEMNDAVGRNDIRAFSEIAEIEPARIAFAASCTVSTERRPTRSWSSTSSVRRSATDSSRISKVDIVRATFAAFEAGDFDALAKLAHPDLEVHDWPEAADPRVYRGPNAIYEARDEWSKAWESVRGRADHLRRDGRPRVRRDANHRQGQGELHRR
jgi:SnoaL-like domain